MKADITFSRIAEDGTVAPLEVHKGIELTDGVFESFFPNPVRVSGFRIELKLEAEDASPKT